jgi:hypothetical protein
MLVLLSQCQGYEQREAAGNGISAYVLERRPSPSQAEFPSKISSFL